MTGAVALAGCGGANGSESAAGASMVSSRPAGADASGTVWLCRPGLGDDPCTSSLATTSIPATGPRTVTTPVAAGDSSFDCFYVYPTVSTQSTDNANLTIQSGEIGAAIAQASPFSPYCRVWAPMYRQRTEQSLAKGLGNDRTADDIAYQSVLAGWKDYLTHYNDHRPVIFIGHSQGAAMLIRLLESQIDPNSTLRSRMVTAIIAGGNVAVPLGQDVGSTFKHIPLCTSGAQTSCVIAYSTFPKRPPADSLFGRPGQGVSLQSGQTAKVGVQVACTNPAALGGGAATLDPLFLTATMPPPAPSVATPWVSYPGLYTAQCRDEGGASWLQVNSEPSAGDARPVVAESLGPQWGYHLEDINLTLGNLLADVSLQERAYTAIHA
jgi:hypothetical protein